MWDGVGLAQGCNHHREFPSLILHKLHIKLLQHLFFSRFTQPKQGWWLLWKRDEISLSLCRPLGVTSSHDLGYWAQNAPRPCYTHLQLMEALGRHLRDSHTTQHADPTTEERVRNWYIWKRIKGASRERQYILKKEDGVTYACGKGRMLPRRSQAEESFITAASIMSSGRERWPGVRLDHFWLSLGFFALCVFWVNAHMQTHSLYSYTHTYIHNRRRLAISSVS